MSKRPLCMALIVWIVFILLFRAYWQEEPRQRAGENLTMTGQVEDITGMDEKTSLIVKNVTDGKGRICKRMKVWMGKKVVSFFTDWSDNPCSGVCLFFFRTGKSGTIQ